MFSLGLAVMNKIIILLDGGGVQLKKLQYIIVINLHLFIIEEFRGTELQPIQAMVVQVLTLLFIAKIPSTDKNLYLL